MPSSSSAVAVWPPRFAVFSFLVISPTDLLVLWGVCANKWRACVYDCFSTFLLLLYYLLSVPLSLLQ